MNFKRYVESSGTWVDSHYIRGTSTDTITLPTTIYGDGTNASLTIKGNTVQNGTPSPSNPVSVDGVGELETSGEHAGDYKIPILNGQTTTPVYLGSVESERKIKKLVFDGTEGWTKSRNDDTAFFKLQLSDYKLQTVAFCSHFEYANVTQSGTTLGFYIVLGSGMIRIRPENVATTSLESFLSFLSTQYSNGTAVTIYYVLDTPETIISNEPLYKIDNYSDSISTSIPTTDEANTLSVGTTVQPSEVTVTFKGWHPVADVHEHTNGAWT